MIVRMMMILIIIMMVMLVMIMMLIAIGVKSMTCDHQCDFAGRLFASSM